ncbi:MAG TPA: dienelactone hydrolase family protein [Streptosporangiaceae bacterium]|nr:dienelactone hydrolase family protein [Streptosporangiaceae bacterium]
MTDISIPVGDRSIPGYLAIPAGGEASRWPGVVVIHEAFGLNDDIRRKADELAAHGYLAVAPDLFGGRSWIRCVRSAFNQLRAGSGPAFSLLDAARAMIAERADCTGKVGVIGFCMGGGFALLCAPRDGFDVAAINYGIVPDDTETALAGACPVVGSFGARDQMGTKPPERLQRALAVLDVKHDIEVYPGSGHRFMTRTSGAGAALGKIARMSYNERDAADAWRRIYAFFAAELGNAEGASDADQARG